MTHINISPLTRARFAGAFRVIKTTDPQGFSTRVTVPAHLTPQEVERSCHRLDGYLVMHAGAFTEVAYQAYLSFSSWFRFHRPQEYDTDVRDFSTRMLRAFRHATRDQQQFSDRDFIEAYFAIFCGDQQANIEKLRSAAYDLFKQDRDHTRALDAAFIAQVYLCACYQCSVAEAVIRTEFRVSGINWDNTFQNFYLNSVAQYADRLLQRKYHIDIVAVRQPLSKIAEYVFEDMTRSAFDSSRVEHNIRAAYLDMPQASQKKYGPIDQLLQNFYVPEYSYPTKQHETK